ncbi:MAG: AAA family ATPase [Candidatus Saccharimonadales bacterium]
MSKPTLLIIRGYSGAGKSALSLEYAQKHDFALLKQDTFYFGMNPASKLQQVTRPKDTELGWRNTLSVVENYMNSGQSIILEGALNRFHDYDSLDFAHLTDLSSKYGYKVILLTIIADEKTRRKRKKKKGYVTKLKVDRMLVELTDRQALPQSSHVLDTSKMSIKKSLIAIHEIVTATSI